LIEPIASTPKININGLLVIYQDVQALATSDKKHQNLDLNSLKRLLLLMVDENDKSVEKMLARDDLS
jgi:uncharacterized membrane protein affecting hemolysin expression